jgi:hypothetical protein
MSDLENGAGVTSAHADEPEYGEQEPLLGSSGDAAQHPTPLHHNLIIGIYAHNFKLIVSDCIYRHGNCCSSGNMDRE